MARACTVLTVLALLLAPAPASAAAYGDEGEGGGESGSGDESSEEPAPQPDPEPAPDPEPTPDPEPAPEPAPTAEPVPLTPASSQPNRAMVIITGDGGLDESSARTARDLLADELTEYMFEVADAPVLDQVILLNDQVRQLAKAMLARRVFALRLSKLGDKLLVRIEMLDGDLESLDFRKSAASGPEELDLVIPRVVKALLEGVPVEDTARIDTVTRQEGRKWEKRPGEFNWGFGVMVGGGLWREAEPAYGLNLKFSYEMEHVKLDTDIGGQFSGDGFFRVGVSAHYLPLTEFWSPYFGGGLSYLFSFLDQDDMGGHGVGAQLQAGIVFFRLHRVRLLAEVGVNLPFYKLENDYWDVKPEGRRDREEWVATMYGMLAVLW